MHQELPLQLTSAEECVDRIIESVGKNIVLGLPLGLGKPCQIANALYQRAQADPGIQLTILSALYIERAKPASNHDALVEPCEFDLLVENPAYEFTLPAPPNPPVSATDHMIGLLASTLVKDGGTLQIGIGSLGDAIVNGVLLRHQQNGVYQDMLSDLGIAENFAEEIENMGGVNPFDQGLYGASEMFIAGFLELYQAGILKRAVYPDIKTQSLVNAGVLSAEVTATTLSALLEAEAVSPHLSLEDFNWLQQSGIFRDQLTFENGEIRVSPELRIQADLSDPENFDRVVLHCLGSQLKNGIVMHGGFFLGPRNFYDALNAMDVEERKNFCMTSVMFVNQLYGQRELAMQQRSHARFINTTMMATLTGAICSDGLEDGQVVSGVGGQYNFVAMAHELPGGRSILLLRSTRAKNGKTSSNIVDKYGSLTIPRHLRDVVITEYGIADLRGKRDKDVIAALLNITDSRFQNELMEKVKKAGKLPLDHQIPAAFQNNYPEQLAQRMSRFKKMGYFKTFPFGADMTDDELVLAGTLKALKGKMSNPKGAIGVLTQAIASHEIPDAAVPYLDRMQLLDAQSLQDKMLRKLIVSELAAAGHI